MPICIPDHLPAIETLHEENIFVMQHQRACTQDIRPLEILLVNLMPKKIQTETQFSRLLGNTPLQIRLELVAPESHVPSNTPMEHLSAFYKRFSEIRHRNFDGCIITGAPVEHLSFEAVDYWNELTDIMDWTESHVHSTFHICWGAQAALYHKFGIQKKPLPEKLFGVYPHTVDYKQSILFRGFDDVFYAPHSRHTTVSREDIEAVPELRVLASSEKAGVYAAYAKHHKQFFVMGHSEYDADTLEQEYLRDVAQNKPISVPENYYPDDDPAKRPCVTWRAHANLLFCNWLNYFVYQTTPYDLDLIPSQQEDEP
ncbi:MAG: homoserine O-succinyltransferase [Clostridia bacterium]|nr:homoserine O-succinyltransferase [Clostridia bacterium]